MAKIILDEASQQVNKLPSFGLYWNKKFGLYCTYAYNPQGPA